MLWKKIIIGVAVLFIIGFIAILGKEESPTVTQTKEVTDQETEEPKGQTSESFDLKKELIFHTWLTDSLVDDYSKKKTPVILRFYKDSSVLDFPGLKTPFEVASIVHVHGTSLAGRSSTRFVYDYKVDKEENLIILDGGFLNEIELKFRNGNLNWPLWKIKDSIQFTRLR